ncbi:MAG: cyclase family protein [Nitrospinota bacterium]
MKVWDLTQPWSNQTPPWPYFEDPRVEAVHRYGDNGLYSLKVSTSMHTGTHMDSPLHFGPGAWDMAEIPLDRLMGTGMVIDMSKKVRPLMLFGPDLVQECAPEPVRKGDILIFHYGWHRYNWCSPERNEEFYFCLHPGPNRAFSDWMVEMGLKWVGVDCGAFEHPFNTAIGGYRPDLVRRWEKEMGKSYEVLLPEEHRLYNHKRTLGNNQMHCENVGGDIAKVLGRRFFIAAYPWRFIRGDASICRILAYEDIGNTDVIEAMTSPAKLYL